MSTDDLTPADKMAAAASPPSPTDTFNLANAAFVDENFAKALVLYSQAIDQDDTNAVFLEKRSATYVKLARYTDALIDANSALQLDPTLMQAHVRQGVALFHLGDKAGAGSAFQKAVGLGDASPTTAEWLSKSAVGGATDSGAAGSAVMGDALGAAGTLAKVKHDWYQTDSHVTLEVLMKGVAAADVTFETTTTTLALAVQRPHGASYNLDLDLFGKIVASESKLSVLKSKIELRLRKSEAVRWTKLEGDAECAALPPVFMATPDESVAAKEKQRQHKWTQLAQDVDKAEAEEKPDGDAALNKLFKDIYGKASDETRRAMVKSYQESGGTVLSTNWAEIGAKQTEIKPPTGSEYKLYKS